MAESLLARAKRSTARTAGSISRRLLPEDDRRRQVLQDFRALSASTRRGEVIDEFHRMYYDDGLAGGTWHETRWFGTTIWKCPLDLWIYQELIDDIRPDLIIETGTAFGGSAHYLASLCELIGNGSVVSIDITAQPDRPEHPRLRYLAGSSIDDGLLEEIRAVVRGTESVMVILDSDHSQDHVARELAAYAPFVTVGSYLVVEDTNVNGHPALGSHGPGPMEAAEQFLSHTTDFARDPKGDKFLLTFNPGGLLRRVRPAGER